MGYIAYAAGTLIAAVAVHSFVTKGTSREDQNTRPNTQPEVPSSETKTESEDEGEVKPAVTIEFSHDGDTHAQPDPKQSTEDLRKEESSLFSIQKRDVLPQEVISNGHTTKSAAPSTLMGPPPARPGSSANPASQPPKPGSMAPPSFLPPPRTRSPPRLKPATVSSLAPPARGSTGRPISQTPTLTPPVSSSASLRVPTQKVLANTRMQPQPQSQQSTGLLPPTTSTQPPSKRPSRKVILSPGHSPLDWASLTQSTSPSAPTTLRGIDATSVLGPFRLGRITPSQLKFQNGRKGKDAWTVYQGRVYNISAYLDFHPGGREELLKGAGRRSDELFAEVHPWVNWEGMLGGCLVGMLVGEDDGEAMGKEGAGNELDEMD